MAQCLKSHCMLMLVFERRTCSYYFIISMSERLNVSMSKVLKSNRMQHNAITVSKAASKPSGSPRRISDICGQKNF